jgi:Beta-propeller domains of methanol dehydrogenase type
MKLNRLLMASALCLSLVASPSAFACEHSGGSGWLSFFHHCDQDQNTSNTGPDHTNTKRQCDQNGQDSGRGNNCDRGKGNGGGYCGTGGSSSGGGTSTGGNTSDGGGGTVYK